MKVKKEYQDLYKELFKKQFKKMFQQIHYKLPALRHKKQVHYTSLSKKKH